jgi:tRNA-intron endonuclease
MIKAILTGDKILSASNEAFSLKEKSDFGEKSKDKIEYSKLETLFLMENDKLELYQNKKKINFEFLLNKAKKEDKKIETKLAVFSDLRKKGYLVKSALKFGAEFRVYEKSASKEHAKWLLYTSKESENFNWHDFAAKNRVAHSTNKKLLIAVVDDELDVSYYEVSWMKP